MLAPAVFIALVAGFKAYSGKADAAAKSSSPVAKVTVQPPPTASAWPVETHSTAADEQMPAHSHRTLKRWTVTWTLKAWPNWMLHSR